MNEHSMIWYRSLWRIFERILRDQYPFLDEGPTQKLRIPALFGVICMQIASFMTTSMLASASMLQYSNITPAADGMILHPGRFSYGRPVREALMHMYLHSALSDVFQVDM